MGQFLEEIPEHLVEWILKQQMFWVATAPLSADGHVNISPKGIEGTFHVTNSRRVWYEDLSGTGAETVAHIKENGRITILFHAFEGPARIVRLYGTGFFYEIGSPEYEALLPSDKRIPGSRAVIGLDVHKVGTTCGYAVPYYQYIGHRSQLVDWAARKESVDNEDITNLEAPKSASLHSPLPATSTSAVVPWTELINPKGMIHWWQSRNLISLDGLPAFSANLGRGFPFTFPNRSTVSQSSFRIPQKNRNRASSTVFIAPPTPEDQHPESFGAQDIRFKGDQYPDMTSTLSSLLPFLLTLIAGMFLGRMYEDYLHIGSGFSFNATGPYTMLRG